tara:strand:- start:8638 stop:10200 length:1563 start_codon:yes stop_codon:yes gene_type:complete
LRNTSIKKLRILYQNIRKKNSIYQSYSARLNYLNLSVHFSRDEREFDISNYKLFKTLKLSNKDGFDKSDIYHHQKSILYYFKNFKEYNYLISNKIFIIIMSDILKFIKQLIDTFGIFIITLIRATLNSLNIKIKNKKKFVKKKIYSTTFFNLRKEKSASYYYPNIKNEKNSIAYLITFAEDCNGLFSISLIKTLRIKGYLSPLYTLGLFSFLRSIFQFIHLYLHDLYLGIFVKNFDFIKFWYGWKKISEIFYSIILYNSLIEIVKKSDQCEFISWYENQQTNRAFSLGVTYGRRKFNSNSTLSTYNGSPFSINNKAQYFPNINEYNIGFWGDKYYLQDKDSMNEMRKYITKIGLKLELEIVEDAMVRSTDKFFANIENIYFDYQITIFTHDSYWDMLACILSIFNTNNKEFSVPRSLVKKNNLIFIRLHPSLNKLDALKEINKFHEIPSEINFKFINNSNESIENSIRKSEHCLFGLSTYINNALSLKASVFAVNTNHINQCPINSKNENFIKSRFLNPL